MEVYKSINELPANKKFGFTIGNFDGVHKGHQGLIAEIKSKCSERKLELVVITFVPHPLVILKNEKSFLLNSYKERQELLAKLGVDHLVELDFTRDLSTLDPADFLNTHIFTRDGIEFFFLGYDFAFGANKAGDHEFVKKYCEKKGVEVEVQQKKEANLGTFSSSLARKLLRGGEPVKAIDILGRPFFLTGRVIKGAGRGKQIGFPTANIELDFSRLIPQTGVYATECSFRGCNYLSITNIGKNPTFTTEDDLNVETNIFDFSGDIYGEEIKVSFFQKIRDEKKFSSVNELIEQISKDVDFRRGLDA
jgi:riboflavin kinase/FMN adenylyltransferase